MELYEHWPGDEFDVETTSTPKIEDRRLIDYEPPVQERAEDKRVTVPYSFIRNELVATHIDRPWGKLNPEEGSSVSVGAGNSVTLGRNVGYGWIMFFMANLDDNGLEIEFYRDGEQIFPTFTPDEMWNTYGLDSGNHLPKIEAYDNSNNEYVVVYDPPVPLHFENSIWVKIINNTGSPCNITNWAQSVVVNED